MRICSSSHRKSLCSCASLSVYLFALSIRFDPSDDCISVRPRLRTSLFLHSLWSACNPLCVRCSRRKSFVFSFCVGSGRKVTVLLLMCVFARNLFCLRCSHLFAVVFYSASLSALSNRHFVCCVDVPVDLCVSLCVCVCVCVCVRCVTFCANTSKKRKPTLFRSIGNRSTGRCSLLTHTTIRFKKASKNHPWKLLNKPEHEHKSE